MGTTLVPSITVTKLRWLAEHEPAAAARVAAVMLPHDWLTHRLLDGSSEGGRVDRRPTAATPRAPVTGRRAPASTATTCW